MGSGTDADEARDFLARADIFFGADEDAEATEHERDKRWNQTINLNDTFFWACSDAEYVSDEELPELASLFRRYGWCGVLYWVNRKRGSERVEFRDVQRFIGFVAKEEQLRRDVEGSSARAYHKLTYSLGE
jgi:hypothetical protein